MRDPARHDDRADPPRSAAPPLRVTLTTVPGAAVIVHVDGAVDQDTRRTLEDALARAVEDRPPRLIIDLAGLDFCYSVCLNALVIAHQEAQAAGVEMVLAATRPQTLRVLELTGTDQVFTVHDSVRAALAHDSDDADADADEPTG